ncbi:MAG: T9SS type A sorting domain-containing protein [Ignavibacteriae bacterium]|nr:T9SS type A sorting domain-containing protein [Ignavibacteriota bacterium]
MKSFLFSLCIAALSLSAHANAQLIINKSNFDFKAGTYVSNFTTEKDLFSVMNGSNLIVEAATVSKFDTSSSTYIASPLPEFPNALLLESYLPLISTLGVNIFNIFTVDETGFKQKGIAVNEQRYGLSSVTGFSTDSLIIPTQICKTTGENILLKFPATAGSVWSSKFRWSAEGTATAFLAGLQDAPISKIGSFTQHDSIIGWGKAQFPTGDGKLSAFYDVLIEQSTFFEVDSFLLNGQPIAESLAANLHIAQGQVTVTNMRKFWRNSFIPMATVDYEDDSTFTNAQSSTFDASIPAPTSVDDNRELDSPAFYPNPTNDNITVSYTQAKSNFATVEFFNLIGTLVKSVPVFSQSQFVNVPVSLADLTSGMYHYAVRNQNGTVIGQGNVTLIK